MSTGVEIGYAMVWQYKMKRRLNPLKASDHETE